MDCREIGGHRIAGEIFSVDESTLRGLDRLEGIGSADGYYRRRIAVEPDEAQLELGEHAADRAADGTMSCWCYFYPAPEDDELRRVRPLLPRYGDAEHALHEPRPTDPVIVAAMSGSDESET